ncbi:MAG: RNA-guided endonuclease IscB [Chromatiaceae bacterium]|nr:RNA-guided endonuclease IscB [Candidatus Thioaporhodococcus sediminis]
MVYVLDKHRRPLMPCTEKRARLLLERKRARIHRMVPFVIRLTDRTPADCELQPIRLKLDPGSKITGIAVVREATDGTHVLNLMELQHRGPAISKALKQRAGFRRNRRSRKLRYRASRFLNRTKPRGWLAPSLRHRIETTQAWVNRLMRWTPVTGIAQELVRFDPQAMDNPDIQGVEYQQGTLAGSEVREYLLEKWNRKCAYCGVANVPLNIDHIHPKAWNGSNRVSNLAMACRPCNQAKGARPIEDFLTGKPEVLQHVLAQAKAPLSAAAAVNSTRWALYQALKDTGVAVDVGSGGKTKWNRSRFAIPKTHALDAACVGDLTGLHHWKRPILTVKATGRGAYQRTRTDASGFPRGYLLKHKQVQGFATGDRVRAIVPNGKYAGTHTGRVAIRATGSFNIQTSTGLIQGIHYRYCRVMQRGDGYGYRLNCELTVLRTVPYPSPA